MWKVVYVNKQDVGDKKTFGSRQDMNLGLLNSDQMLLPTELLELW